MSELITTATTQERLPMMSSRLGTWSGTTPFSKAATMVEAAEFSRTTGIIISSSLRISEWPSSASGHAKLQLCAKSSTVPKQAFLPMVVWNSS
eukprot:1875844-Lingulodinium_polyedra.AAC.1